MTVLILAGTGEARALCANLGGRDVLASLAGLTQTPKKLGVPTRIGGFGGDAGFESFVAAQRIRAVCDATHPFASIGHRTSRLCQAHNIPYLRLLRAPWPEATHWETVPNFAKARAALPSTGAVFLATGAQSARHFAGLQDPELWLRRVDPSPEPPPWRKGGYVIGLPSVDPAREQKMFEKYNITCVLAKNSGGPQGQAKLVAAHKMGLRVIMLDRPSPPNAPTIASVTEAHQWINQYV